ncbi:hypothetical protein BUALT_Bualt06G0099700 [Buddleja alternifolia]|uniref:Late embryogenesis abundant protein LEA-2 subgroup domain-containing protein n=1 Tax=Buddleja alternifolia TaxID=168488 RepID=A0AAV6XDQ0_9LAMI|nr:hypothetical protein BUALT_Bualt06G0099700 [Buddleja alternifolia]
MADQKDQQPSYPLAPAANGHALSDAEAAASPTTAADPIAASAAAPTAGERRKNNRTKCLLYIVLFVIFHTGIILLFALTILRVRPPRFRVRAAAFQNFAVGTPSNPSFNFTMNAELAVRNANFGRYRYRDTTVEFFYRRIKVGEAFVGNSRVNWRSTSRFDVAAELSLVNAPPSVNAQLGGDLRSGVMAISSEGRMRGRVEVLFVMKRNRSTAMNCSMEIVTATQQLRNITDRAPLHPRPTKLARNVSRDTRM